MEVSVACAYVHHRRQAAAVACRESALVEVHIVDDVRIE